jgi:hypothetical protein
VCLRVWGCFILNDNWVNCKLLVMSVPFGCNSGWLVLNNVLEIKLEKYLGDKGSQQIVLTYHGFLFNYFYVGNLVIF